MPHRRLFIAVLMLVLIAAAAPKPPGKPASKSASPPAPAPKAIAPDTVTHSIAMFLANLSQSGKDRVTFKASAEGNRFFYEEAAGVTVYAFDGKDGYRKEAFLPKTTLDQALNKYREPLNK
jgi:hypothetical protein